MKRNVTELLMVWKDPTSRQRFVVGELTEDQGTFTFQYTNPALDEARKHGFKNYPSFPDLAKIYSQTGLFNSIAGRLPRPKRPDYPLILERYGLDSTSSDMQILEATRGRTPTDTFEFVQKVTFEPTKPFLVEFEIAGIRYRDADKISKELAVGTELFLVRDHENEFDSFAVRVTTKEKVPLGYVPNYRSEAIALMLEHVNDKYKASIIKTDFENNSSDEWIKMRVHVTR